MTETTALDSRITRIEDQMSRVITSMGEVVAEQRATNANVDALVAAMEKSNLKIESLADNGRTNWGLILGTLGLLGTLILLYTGPIEDRLDEEIKSSENDHRQVSANSIDIATIKETLRWVEKGMETSR